MIYQVSFSTKNTLQNLSSVGFLISVLGTRSGYVTFIRELSFLTIKILLEKIYFFYFLFSDRAPNTNSRLGSLHMVMRGSRKFCQRGSNFDRVFFKVYEGREDTAGHHDVFPGVPMMAQH